MIKALRYWADASGLTTEDKVQGGIVERKANIEIMTESVKNYAANLTMSVLAEGNDDAPFVDAETGEVIEPLKK